jgi:hypothetical protein
LFDLYVPRWLTTTIRIMISRKAYGYPGSYIYFILQVCHCNRSIEYYSCKWLEFPHRDSSPITGFKKRATYGISNYFKIEANINKHNYNKTKQTYWWTKTKFSNMFELISSLVEISGRVVTGVHFINLLG